MNLTVHFEGQYWVGVVEDGAGPELRACRRVFGAERRDAEVLAFVNRDLLPPR
jgi:hypothetical protein